MQQLIRDVMTREAHVIGPNATLTEATAKMQAEDVGALPVWQGGELLGIITDRDVAVRAVSQGHDPDEARVKDFMTRNVVTCREDQTLSHAAALMGHRQIRRLVVVDQNEQVKGIVTLDDLAVDAQDARLSGRTLETISVKSRQHHEPFKRILVTLDGSKPAEHVLAPVEELAEKFGSTIILLRVVSPVEASLVVNAGAHLCAESRPMADDLIVVTQDMRWDAPSYLHSIERRFVFRGIHVQCEYPSAQKPAEAIVRRARHLGVDLIAMTTHGRGALGRAVFGSVAGEVLRTAPCPVLLVKSR